MQRERVRPVGLKTASLILLLCTADVYVAALPCQWIDITGVPDGTYTVRVAINANGIIDEDNVLPNNADVRVQITGDQVTVVP
jgi:hypothetical protein